MHLTLTFGWGPHWVYGQLDLGASEALLGYVAYQILTSLYDLPTLVVSGVSSRSAQAFAWADGKWQHLKWAVVDTLRQNVGDGVAQPKLHEMNPAQPGQGN